MKWDGMGGIQLNIVAIEYSVPLNDIQILYATSEMRFKSEILLLLNDEQTACDTNDGWTFLVNEASKPQHRDNESVEILRDCLEFFLIVKDAPPETHHYLSKVEQLEEIFNA